MSEASRRHSQGILARAALIFLRLYLGLVFVLSGWSKIQNGITPGFRRCLEQVALGSCPAFYQDFVRQVVIPNASFFASLIAWGELLVGITLMLGLATRLSATLALLLTLNYLLAKGSWFWPPTSSDAAHAAIALGLLVGAAGRTFGLDAALAQRWPRSPLW